MVHRPRPTPSVTAPPCRRKRAAMGCVAEVTCRRAQQSQRVLPGHWGWQCNDGDDAVCSRRGDAAKGLCAQRGRSRRRGAVRYVRRCSVEWVHWRRCRERAFFRVRPAVERPLAVLAAAALAILPAASPGSSPGEGYRSLLPLHWGARWAWGARSLAQEVRCPLHRSAWVRRERLELCVEGLRRCERPPSGCPHARAVPHPPHRPARA